MCLVPNLILQEADDKTISGTWFRVSPESIYEFWPHLETSVEIILVACITTLLRITTANTQKELNESNTTRD